MHETADEFRWADLIAVQGTRLRAAQQHPLRCMSTPTHKVYSWGWKMTAWSNKSAGVAIYVSHAVTPSVVCSYDPPAKLAGRIGALRLKTAREDVLVFSIYSPPPSTLRRATHGRLLDSMHQWIAIVLQKAPARTCLVLLGDLNTGFAGPDDESADALVGPSGWGRRMWTTDE
jgi:hypothetical protein